MMMIATPLVCRRLTVKVEGEPESSRKTTTSRPLDRSYGCLCWGIISKRGLCVECGCNFLSFDFRFLQFSYLPGLFRIVIGFHYRPFITATPGIAYSLELGVLCLFFLGFLHHCILAMDRRISFGRSLQKPANRFQ